MVSSLIHNLHQLLKNCQTIVWPQSFGNSLVPDGIWSRLKTSLVTLALLTCSRLNLFKIILGQFLILDCLIFPRFIKCDCALLNILENGHRVGEKTFMG